MQSTHEHQLRVSRPEYSQARQADFSLLVFQTKYGDRRELLPFFNPDSLSLCRNMDCGVVLVGVRGFLLYQAHDYP